jgi:hypothetical protein
MPMKVGDYLAMVNRKRTINRPRKSFPRTIDISDIPESLLQFWAEKNQQGVSARELGWAYGMNGLQMRSAISQWRRKRS